MRVFIAKIIVNCTLEAILSTAFIDRICGNAYKLCALHDCEKLLMVCSKHKQAYCTMYCAHKASVRRGRELKKAAKQNAEAAMTN